MAYLQVLLGQDEQCPSRRSADPRRRGRRRDIAADNHTTHKQAKGEALPAGTTSSALREAREQ